MRHRYPAIEPHDRGRLDVGDGHHIAWEISGARDGIPALVVHGGPGQGSNPSTRRYFDPAVYRIVLFDQRGCGSSTPHAGEPGSAGVAALDAITTDHLVGDIERLREHLGVDRWVLFGGSWGCVLALAYAERHPARVAAMVLLALAAGRRVETDLLTRGLRGWFPEAWQAFVAGLSADERAGDIAAAFAARLADPDPAIADRAARAWCTWEDAMMPMYPPNDDFDDPRYRLAWARLVTHVWRHGAWLDDDQLLRDAGRLAGIPVTLVQGILDPGNLVGTPWLLHAALPDSTLVLVDDAGHGFSDSGMVDALVRATDGYRSLRPASMASSTDGFPATPPRGH
jgi:proline iminopeptidase